MAHLYWWWCNWRHMYDSYCVVYFKLKFICQSGTWKYSGGSTVHTGLIGNGQQIPLPNGFIQNQCSWSVSNSENPHGWKPNYFAGQVATADANRIVKCGYYDEYNFHPGTNRPDLSGKCSFIISCS